MGFLSLSNTFPFASPSQLSVELKLRNPEKNDDSERAVGAMQCLPVEHFFEFFFDMFSKHNRISVPDGLYLFLIHYVSLAIPRGT